MESARIHPKSWLIAPKGVNGDAFFSSLVRNGCCRRTCVRFLAEFGRPERGLAGYCSDCHHWSWIDRRCKYRGDSASKSGNDLLPERRNHDVGATGQEGPKLPAFYRRKPGGAAPGGG